MKRDMQKRKLNGYVVLYLPDHPQAMQSDNWKGYIYEHRVIAEKMMGRPLRAEEEVHHLNEIRDDNRKENLLVLEASQHTKLHSWLRSLSINIKDLSAKQLDLNTLSFCPACQKELVKGTNAKFCSRACHREHAARNIPPKDILEALLADNTYEAIGRIYNVSGNAVKKWKLKYNL